MNYQKTGHELMSRDELAVMPGDKCILQLRGVRSFYSDKFDITKHRRYRELLDFDKNNEFHIEEYLEHRLVLPREEAFVLYEYELSPEEIEAAEKEVMEDVGCCAYN